MAKNGFKIIDGELHVMEPVDLWEKYIDLDFRDRAPRRLNERLGHSHRGGRRRDGQHDRLQPARPQYAEE